MNGTIHSLTLYAFVAFSYRRKERLLASSHPSVRVYERGFYWTH